MLYSIIPPLLMLFSVIGIILFLVRKNPDVNKLEQKEQLIENNKNVSGIIKEQNRIKIITKINQILLVILEKIVRKVRLFFLKLENIFKLWGEVIRRKRSSRLAEKNNNGKFEEREHLDGIVEKQNEHNLEKKELQEKLILKRKKYQEESREKFFRPIISDRVVAPSRRREVKDQLEELLIERIAVNPKDIEAYERLGEYYLEIKNLEYAKECFRQILKMNPTNNNVKYKLQKLERMLRS